MVWNDKNGIAQNSKIVLTISNWHFNRDTLKDAVGPTCKMENVMVTLKLSSSVFEGNNTPAAAAGGSNNDADVAGDKDDSSSNGGDRAVVSRNGDVFHFDKNGSIIPYPAFIELLDDQDFEEYLKLVKSKYYSKESEEKSGPKTPPADNFRELDDEELTDLKNKLARKRKLDMIYGRGGKKAGAIEFANENVAFEPLPVDFISSQGRVRDLLDDDDEDAGSGASGAGGGTQSLEENDEKVGKSSRRRGVKK